MEIISAIHHSWRLFLQNHRTCVLKVEAIFETSNFQKSTCVFGTKPRLYPITSRSQIASLLLMQSWFNVHTLKIGLFVCKCITYFQSLMDVQPLWHVDVYQQNVFRRGRNEAENHIPNRNLFLLYPCESIKIQMFLSADQTSIPNVRPLPFNHSRNRNLVLRKSSVGIPASI